VKLDYRQFAFLDEQKQCLGVVGVWCFPRVWCGLQLDIDNFVVDHKARSLGIGKKLLDQCIEYGTARGAMIATLDTFVENPSSHRFYFREGFTIRGYHFAKPLQGQAIWK
jgi:GNAT superfamily N-acetyltransferase